MIGYKNYGVRRGKIEIDKKNTRKKAEKILTYLMKIEIKIDRDRENLIK